ncbi:MAG: hypothetical protein C4527_29240 [Candidatus Omnitrophota bacterium]|jgi:hypothetical protein|nr:MAG: hypothetical protein C4527_29240 [Candidatus Omnitrophota bacterium]
MSEFHLEKIAGVSFADIFGSDEVSISFEKVEAFLDQMVVVASEKAKTSPNQLVRLVHNGQVFWMTQQQAAEFLKKGSDPDIRKEVEQALRGELKSVRQELEILLAIAFYMLHQYKENSAIPQEEIDRIEPSLRRRQKEIAEGVSSTTESEAILAEKRRRNPLISHYEEKMGEFLNCKARGDLVRAAALAKELALEKKQYVLQSRSIEPDIRTIYYHRLNLQKTKKRLLSTQSDLCSSRQGLLKWEVNELKNNLGMIREELDVADREGMDSAASQIKRLRQYDTETMEKNMMEKSMELVALQCESDILARKEKETESVIAHIAENVLHEQELKIDIAETTRQTNKPLFQTETKHQSTIAKKKSSGMHISKFKDH